VQRVGLQNKTRPELGSGTWVLREPERRADSRGKEGVEKAIAPRENRKLEKFRKEMTANTPEIWREKNQLRGNRVTQTTCRQQRDVLGKKRKAKRAT